MNFIGEEFKNCIKNINHLRKILQFYKYTYASTNSHNSNYVKTFVLFMTFRGNLKFAYFEIIKIITFNFDRHNIFITLFLVLQNLHNIFNRILIRTELKREKVKRKPFYIKN